MRSSARSAFAVIKCLCLLLLIWALVLCSNGQSRTVSLHAAACCAVQEMPSGSPVTESVGEIHATVLSIQPTSRLERGALRTAGDARFVVALLVDSSEMSYTIPGTDMKLPSHQVVLFAIHSVVQTFGVGKMIGGNFRMRVTMEINNGVKQYQLKRI